ncbi:hypothetical protein V1520DRAFT_341037 [Lipomyces starkeyi]|uniref:Pre-mRNA-processing protein PRP40 n=1 Tax=Lipomyces starkeyi NRRL Y-11557 TaxID=675824 RepID=A0A1E3Q0F9_LIPST|nr:hypothetical protein LIPSTDRAFT_5985 [Lipomyces starkeyi NRRL Y-11557]
MSATTSLWQEHTAADGRVYYYNTQTRDSSWTKPDALLTPRERALAKIAWKEYETPDGRKYWHNKDTSESVWQMPGAYKTALQEAEEEEEAAAAAAAAAAEEEERRQAEVQNHRMLGQQGNSYQNGGLRFYSNPEESFIAMLKSHGIDYSWPWSRALREIVTDDRYTALSDAQSRKAAFDRFIENARKEAGDIAKETLARRQNDFLKVLEGMEAIKPYSRWKTIQPILVERTEYQSLDSEHAHAMFLDYVTKLRASEREAQAKLRDDGLELMREYFEQQVDSTIDIFTKWHDVRERMKHDTELRSEQKIVKGLNMLDILNVYEECMKQVESRFLDERKEAKRQQRSSARKNREEFIKLLEELLHDGKITAETRWMDIYPLTKGDSRFDNIVGQEGSGPLDLFWDTVEKINKDMRIKRDILLDVLADRHFQVTDKTTFEEFENVLVTDARAAEIEQSVHVSLFEKQRSRVLRKLEEDRHLEERRLRRRIDALRSVMRHLEPPMTGQSTWEEIRDRIKDTPEFLALDSEDNRKLAFEKQLVRVKEKEEGGSRERDRERDRDRDRDHKHPRS